MIDDMFCNVILDFGFGLFKIDLNYLNVDS